MECFGVKAKAKADANDRSFKIETLLVPTDFSEESLKAIAYVRALLNYFPGSVHLVYVHDVDFAYAVPALMTSSPLISTDVVERRYRKDLEKLANSLDCRDPRRSGMFGRGAPT